MLSIPRPRFSLASISMFVVTSAAASALFTEIMEHTPKSSQLFWNYDAPTLAVLAISLTAIALGTLKNHTAVQIMLQATAAFLGYFSLISIADAGQYRVLLYWFQTAFAATVALPLAARRAVKSRMPRGPRRTWWKNTYEALIFAFINMLMVAAGALLQLVIAEIGQQLL